MKFIIGLHAIESWIDKSPSGAVLYIGKATKRNIELREKAKSKGIKTEEVEILEISRRCGGEDHKGVLLSVPASKESGENDLKTLLNSIGNNGLLILVDGITDPRNLGAILRSAEQFSTDAVIIPERRAVADSPAVSKTSAGADAVVPIISAVNLNRVIDEVKKSGFWVYGADMEGIPAYNCALTGKVALVLGSEGKGLRPNVKNHCDELISIPTTGVLYSLNVSVAAGILLYEIRRQQRQLPEPQQV